MTYGTSMHALKQRARLQPGEMLLVLGASGGVGLARISSSIQISICMAYAGESCGTPHIS